jgi:exopolysaccharide biosynthesis operon protein EpsL
MGKAGLSAGLLAGALVAWQAAAQDADPVMFRVGAMLNWDSNIFRVPDGAPDPQAARGLSGKSDHYALGSLGMGFDNTYGQQRFVLDGEARTVHYGKFTFLDREEFDYRGEWQWSVGSRLTGSVRSGRSEALTPFEDQGVQGRNVSVTRNDSLVVDAWLFAGWHLLGGLSKSKRTNSETFRAQPDSRQTNHDIGARYDTLAGNSVTYMRRSSRGENFGELATITAIDDEFSVREDSVAASWTAGGAHSVTGRMSQTEYRYVNLSRRDFSGDGVDLLYTWLPTDGLTLGLSALRVIAPWTADVTASHRIDETVAVTPVWRMSDRIVLSARLHRTSTEFKGSLVSGVDVSRRDVQRVARLLLRWTPREPISLGASFGRELRTSSDAASNFDATTAGLDAALRF